MGEQRLQKILAALPVFADPDKDVITVNGRRIHAVPKVYFLLNKPKGVICTNSDPQGRKRAIDMVRTPQRVFCVGRLDADTTGLIIITNDSELTNKLTHPRFGISKTYVVRIKGLIDGKAVEKLKKGIWLAEGKTRRASVKVLKRNYKESLIEITLRQGLNRQIRRMLAKLGLQVKSLKRAQIGKITARGLGLGKSRKLSAAEVRHLEKAAGGGN